MSLFGGGGFGQQNNQQPQGTGFGGFGSNNNTGTGEFFPYCVAPSWTSGYTTP